MDIPKFQSSFIPNKDMQGPAQIHLTGGFLKTIGVVLFVTAVTSSVGVFAYGAFLKKSIASMEKDLADARTSLDPDFITKVAKTNSQFVSAKELISKHQVPTAFFELLQKNTVSALRFSSLTYLVEKDGNVKVSMKGAARSYATVAAQAKVFGDNPMIIDPQFSNLDLNKEGDVIFEFEGKIDKKALSYEKLIGGLDDSAAAPKPTTAISAPKALIATSTPASSTPVATPTKATSTPTKKP